MSRKVILNLFGNIFRHSLNGSNIGLPLINTLRCRKFHVSTKFSEQTTTPKLAREVQISQSHQITEPSVLNKPQTVEAPEKRELSLGHSMGFFFNTHATVKNLEKYGFSTDEAEAVTELLTQILLAQSDSHFKTFITKPQLEISVQQLLALIDSVKKDMAILDKSQFANLRHDLEKISLVIKQLDNKLLDEVTKLKGSAALDMNLEKSRIMEENHKLKSEIQILTHRIGIETANMQTEMANVRVYTEKTRSDTLKYIGTSIIGLIVSMMSLIFLAYRYMISN